MNKSRRSFLKGSALAGTSVLLGSASAADSQRAGEASALEPAGHKGFALFRREYNSIDQAYEISPDYERMDHKDTIFGRWGWDPKYHEPGGLGMSFIAKESDGVENPASSEKHSGRLETALNRASWGSHNDATPFTNGGLSGMGPFNDWERFSEPATHDTFEFDSPADAAKYIKRAALFLGASEVGIAPYDERWTYTKEFRYDEVLLEGKKPDEATHNPIEFPFEVKSVIAFTHEMDYDALKCGGELNEAAAGLEYSRMAEVTHKMSIFLNKLGYRAIPAGNDIGMSIPVAIQAGLGEISRMGTLVSEKFGSRVRLSKVYTDLELQPDKIKSFGVQEFCIKCKKCAEHCPSNAISLEDEPTLEPSVSSPSSNGGVKKWYQDNERCFSQWERQGASCGVCLTVCPYNKIENWVHHLSRVVVSMPVGRDIARQMDDAFGYGKMGPQHVDDFWNQED